MGRPTKASKGVLSLSVSNLAREMLVKKSEDTGLTMSDLADRLIVEAFRTKRGLAKRITDAKADVLLETEQKVAAAEAAKAAALAYKAAKLEQIDNEWRDSLQSLLIDLDGEQADRVTRFRDDLDEKAVLRWYFDAGVWCIAGLNAKLGIAGLPSPRYFGARILPAVKGVAVSSQFPDKAFAADVIAELPCWQVSAEQFDFIVSHYDWDKELLFTAWLSDAGSEEYEALISVIKASDLVFSSGLYEAAVGK